MLADVSVNQPNSHRQISAGSVSDRVTLRLQLTGLPKALTDTVSIELAKSIRCDT